MNILKPVVRFFTENSVLKVISLFVAIIIWFHSVLERSYSAEKEVPIYFDNLAKKYTITDTSAVKGKIKIFAKGRDLFRIYLRPPYINVDLSKIKKGAHQFILGSENVYLSSSAEIKEITPHKVRISLKELEEKKVSLDIPQKGNPKKGFSILRIIQKDTVRIWGSKDQTDLISTLSTEPLILDNISESKEEALRVIIPEGLNLKCRPCSVRVYVEVEEESKRILSNIPLEIIATEGVKVKADPSEAQIEIKGPKSRVEGVKLKDIRLILDVSDLGKGKYDLLAEIKLPSGVNLVKCEPSRFSVTIE